MVFFVKSTGFFSLFFYLVWLGSPVSFFVPPSSSFVTISLRGSVESLSIKTLAKERKQRPDHQIGESTDQMDPQTQSSQSKA